jgi:hypothetical protein
VIALAIFWFLTGVLFGAACFAVIGPWLRAKVPWQVALCAGVMLVLVVGLYRWLGRPDLISQPSVSTTDSTSSLSSAAPAASALTAGSAPTAGSMSTAIASLEARLAKGGGSADDWELLAKSYEFQGRPADASGARARHLPQDSAAQRSGITVSGEVSLAAALNAKAPPGATLFIVAKSVDSPGAPVAVLRASVGTWPVKFTLDDSQSMLPGRNLSSAGRVRIEARISQTGQPQPAAGDLQGSSGVVDPADQVALKILIDRTIT